MCGMCQGRSIKVVTSLVPAGRLDLELSVKKGKAIGGASSSDLCGSKHLAWPSKVVQGVHGAT